MVEILKLQKKVKQHIKSHNSCVNEIIETQKESWKIGGKLKECGTNLNAFLKNNNCDDGCVPDKMKKKYNSLQKKQNQTAKHFKTTIKLFQKNVDEEKVLRQRIIEKVAGMKEILMNRMKEGIMGMYNNLVEAMNMAKGHEGYDIITGQLENFSVDRVVEELFRVTCETYCTYDPEDFMFETNFERILPSVERSPCDYKAKGMHNNTYFKTLRDVTVKYSDLPREFELPDEGFFPNSGGFGITKDQLDDKYRQGFLNIKSGYQVKLKLMLMGGNVGFGWSRKSRLSTKKWGFYFLNKENPMVQSLITSFTPPSLVTSIVKDGKLCPEKFPGFKDLSEEEKITKITEDLDFIPIKESEYLSPSSDEDSVYNSDEDSFYSRDEDSVYRWDEEAVYSSAGESVYSSDGELFF